MENKRRMVLLGGGELRNFTTLKVDAFAVGLIEKEEGERVQALFFPTAAHDSKPYFNSFRKTYTSRLGAKVDVALLTTGEMDPEHIREKVEKADLIYLGGGDTAYLLEVFSRTGADKLLIEAYEKGKVIVGLSAGAICWFEYAHSDYEKMREGKSAEYAVIKGMGIIKGICVPHYDEESRRESAAKLTGYSAVTAIESDCGIYYENEEPVYAVGDGNAYVDGKELLKRHAPGE